MSAVLLAEAARTERDRIWMDEHYPRCARCGLRTYVNNLTGLRDDEPTGTAGCSAALEPMESRPDYPWHGSRHLIAGES